MESLAPAAASAAATDADTPVTEAPPLVAPDSPLLMDLNVTLQARLGSVTMAVSELLALRAGDVLTLASLLDEPVELYLNEALVGRGEIVAVDDRFGIRIAEMAAG